MGCIRSKYEWISQLGDHPNLKIITTKSVKGIVGELDIIYELTKRGYYVAKSCDPQCPFYIVIVDRNGKIQLLDIKTNTYRKHKHGKSLKDKPKGSYKINRSPTKQQKKLGIKLLMVDYES